MSGKIVEFRDGSYIRLEVDHTWLLKKAYTYVQHDEDSLIVFDLDTFLTSNMKDCGYDGFDGEFRQSKIFP